MNQASLTSLPRLLIVIPARGGSVGIPGKALALLGTRPLLAYSVSTALQFATSQQLANTALVTVCVSSDNDQILSVAKSLGALALKRPDALADGQTPLDPVITQAQQVLEDEQGAPFDLIITLQPTTPFLTRKTLAEGLHQALKPENSTIDTWLTAVNEPHLSWNKTETPEGKVQFSPNYTERVNRQWLPPHFRETGGMVICRGAQLRKTGTRIGHCVSVVPVTGPEAIDIDTPEELALCRYYLNRKSVVFALVGHRNVGLGHVNRSLIVANALVGHTCQFVLDAESELGCQMLTAAKHKAFCKPEEQTWADAIQVLKPDVVINDRLDTTAEEMNALKAAGMTVINFEDLGTGATLADVLINDMYPPPAVLESDLTGPAGLYGPRYFCPRPEFMVTSRKDCPDKPSKILLTFGGTDPANLTEKVLRAITSVVQANALSVTTVVGLGYSETSLEELKIAYPAITFLKNISNMAALMREADVVITSAGRTIYEIACVGTPAMVLAQNQRELTHYWAQHAHGFWPLGLGTDALESDIASALNAMVTDKGIYQQYFDAMQQHDFRGGLLRVVHHIEGAMQGFMPVAG